MPRLTRIEGCGPMVASTYEEVTAAMDRAYAVAEDQPLPIGEAFAWLAAQAEPDPAEPAAGAFPPPLGA